MFRIIVQHMFQTYISVMIPERLTEPTSPLNSTGEVAIAALQWGVAVSSGNGY
jgi:hypothetical protein